MLCTKFGRHKNAREWTIWPIIKKKRSSGVKGCWHTLTAVKSAWIPFRHFLANTIPSSFTSPAFFLLVAAIVRNYFNHIFFAYLLMCWETVCHIFVLNIRGKIETNKILWTYCSSRSSPHLKYIYYRIRQDLCARGHRDDECLEVTVLKKLTL